MNVKLIVFLVLTAISTIALLFYTQIIPLRMPATYAGKLLSISIVDNQNDIPSTTTISTTTTSTSTSTSSTTAAKRIRTVFSAKNFRPDLGVDSEVMWPYISGYNFLLIADYICDFVVNNIEQNVDRIKDGDIIYVKTDFEKHFFSNIYSKITKKFILITHNSDASTNSAHKHFLDDEKFIAWFGVHPSFAHPKFVPMTIGFGISVYADQRKFVREFNHSSLVKWSERKYLLYINFNANNNPGKRQHLFTAFKNVPDVLVVDGKTDYITFMKNIGNSKFTLCPVGAGLDTHRFTETVFMGSIPIVERSLLMPIYMETTSIVLANINDLNITMLQNPQQYVTNMNFSRQILMMQTWMDRIDTFRNKVFN